MYDFCVRYPCLQSKDIASRPPPPPLPFIIFFPLVPTATSPSPLGVTVKETAANSKNKRDSQAALVSVRWMAPSRNTAVVKVPAIQTTSCGYLLVQSVLRPVPPQRGLSAKSQLFKRRRVVTYLIKVYLGQCRHSADLAVEQLNISHIN